MAPTIAAETTQPPANLKGQISKQLRSKANEFLNSRRCANNLVEIICYLEQTIAEQGQMTAPVLALEVIFTELLKRREMSAEVTPMKLKDESPEGQYRDWLLTRYEETLTLILKGLAHEKNHEASQALVSYMKLLAAEGKYPLEKNEPHMIPRLRAVLQQLLSATKSHSALLQRFKEYAEYLDVVFNSWKLLPHLSTRQQFQNPTFALNYLELINALPVTKSLHEEKKLLCCAGIYEYSPMRRNINKVWNCMMQWTEGIEEPVHKLMLIVLLERVLPHLEKPVLLTDFLMDSLDCGGAVSLLALQGIFTLIQKHNITYPHIYEKLYSMFEPEIFHTKFKARLFYLADIFLSSTHLSESLVAAFVKRLAHLSLVAPPQDIIIILQFIGNLILRHPGLKRLICAPTAEEFPRDPFISDEREPGKSMAIESSLWEIVLLQKHALPSVANAAKFISQPLPTVEWDLSNVLEIKENDIFDEEIAKNTKQYALAFERPQGLFLTKNDKVQQYWKLF